MTDTPEPTSEIAAYQAAVERHLGDLPSAERDDLVADLEAHLTEIAADLEPGVTLADHLGSPEAYAQELRETVVVEGERPTLRRGLSNLTAPARTRIRSIADRVTASAGMGTAAECRKRLQPAWWILRGCLAAALFTWMFLYRRAVDFLMMQWTASPIEQLTVKIVAVSSAIAIAGVFVWASLWLGNRSERWGRRGQMITGVAGVVLVGYFALNYFTPLITFGASVKQMDADMASRDYSEPYVAEDVYPYDAEGNLLTGVYLFDERGIPLGIGDRFRCAEEMVWNPFAEEWHYGGEATGDQTQEFDVELGFQYPICDPYDDRAEEPTEEPTEGSADEGTENPTEEPTDESTANPTDEE